MKLNRQGMTFIEVLVTAAISAIGGSLLFFFVQKVRVHKSGVDGSLIVKESMADNVVEIKGAVLADLPAIGSCLIRTYDTRKKFISETSQSTPCTKPTLVRGQYKILWNVESTPSVIAHANFDNPLLELPTTTDPLRQVTVHAWYYRDNSSQVMDHSQIVIFRR